MLPYLSQAQKVTAQGYAFRGYNANPFGRTDAFCKMENMTGEDAPLIRTREKRRKVRTIGSGMVFGHERLGWIEGTDLYWNGEKVGTVTQGEHQAVAMGARWVFFPDKIMLNTETGEVENLENSVEISGSVTYESCDLMGEPVEAGSAVYVKVSAAGIGQGFHEGDVTAISGDVLPEGSFQMYNVQADSFIVLGTVDQDQQTGTGIRITRSVPDMDYVTECDNRLWGCSSANHEVYACKLGDPTNWRSYQGLANDAYAVTIGSPGDFTGAATHLGYVLFFKEDRILKLYGNRPGNYQLSESRVRGVKAGCARSLTVLEETLYYLSTEGWMAYGGSLPESVHGAFFNAEHMEGVAAAGFGTLYVSVKDRQGNPSVYTLRNGNWHREDGARFVSMCFAQGNLWALDDKGILWRLRGGCTAYDAEDAADEGDLDWMIETADLTLLDLTKKRVQKIRLRYRLENGAVCSIAMRYDGQQDAVIYQRTQGAKDKKSQVVNIIPRRCDHMRLILSGKGMMKLGAVECLMEAGSDL